MAGRSDTRRFDDVYLKDTYRRHRLQGVAPNQPLKIQDIAINHAGAWKKAKHELRGSPGALDGEYAFMLLQGILTARGQYALDVFVYLRAKDRFDRLLWERKQLCNSEDTEKPAAVLK